MPLGKPEVSPSTGNLCHHSQHFQSRWGWGFPSPHFYRKIQPCGSITMKKKQRKVLPKQPQQSFKNAVFSLLLLSGPTSEATSSLTMHTVSFDWFLFGLEWILNLEFCLQKLLIFYQKLVWNIRSRLNFSTFWVFRPVFRYVGSKLKLCAKNTEPEPMSTH